MHHKFKAQPTVTDGIRFSSKLESRYYTRLKALQQKGDLLFFLRQVPIHLPGEVRYVVDFVEFWKNEEVIFTEVKGMQTPLWVTKKKMIESIYPFKIHVVTAKDIHAYEEW